MDFTDLKKIGDFSRQRTLDFIETLKKSGRAAEALAFRPAPGRANIGWQLMHLAATDQRFLFLRFQGVAVPDKDLNDRYAHGSVPADVVPPLDEIEARLASERKRLWAYIDTLAADQLTVVPPSIVPGPQRTMTEWLMMLAWHEGHHHGQSHITFNIFKAANGMM
jgi:uncharacterized damage-inducible protein DinB